MQKKTAGDTTAGATAAGAATAGATRAGAARAGVRVGAALTGMVLAAGVLTACGSGDGQSADSRVVTVTGAGEVRGAPDTLRATIGVEATGPDVSSAIDQVNARAAKVTDAVKAAGVATEDIQTQQLSITPSYTSPAPGQVSTVGAYQASNTIRVIIRDLPAASKVLDDAVAAGGDQVRLQGLTFSITDDAALISDARERAFADARSSAEQYAKLSDDSLGDVVSIDEGITGGDAPVALDSRSPAAESMVIEPGEQTVRVQVTVKWRLT